MDRTFALTTRNTYQPPAPTRNDAHAEAVGPSGGLRAIGPMRMLSEDLLARMPFEAVLNDAARESGMKDYQLAERLNVNRGHLSRWFRGEARTQAQRFVGFCLETRSLGVLQHMANSVGCDLVPRAPQQARILELQAELAKLQGHGGEMPA